MKTGLARRSISTLADRLLPARDRELIRGDLLEEGVGPGTLRHLLACVAIAAHVHAEPYRDEAERLGALWSVAIGGCLLWLVPVASEGAPSAVDLYRDPLSRLALQLWSASHVTSAVAAGLVVGHAPWVASGSVRWHTSVALSLVVWWAWGATGSGPLAGLALLSTAWVGYRGRDQERASAS